MRTLIACLMILAPAAHASDLAYYQQFHFLEDRIDDGDGDVRIQYRYLLGNEEVMLDTLRKVSAHLQLILLPTGKFKVFYNEMNWQRATESDPWTFVPSFPMGCDVTAEGDWSVPANELTVADLGTGTRLFHQQQNAVAFKLAKALKTQEVVGTTFKMAYGYSNVGLNRPSMPWCP